MLIFPLLTLQAAQSAKCFRPPRARGTAPASTMSLAPRWAPQQRQSWSKESPSARITSVMAATTAKAAASTLSSSAVSTAAPFLPTGSGDGVNLTYRTTLTTVTVTTNETSINATAFPEPVMESSGMGMVLIPFGIITVLGLAVAIVRKYLQINITNLGLSTVVFQIRKGKVKHDCVSLNQLGLLSSGSQITPKPCPKPCLNSASSPLPDAVYPKTETVSPEKLCSLCCRGHKRFAERSLSLTHTGWRSWGTSSCPCTTLTLLKNKMTCWNRNYWTTDETEASPAPTAR